MEIRDLEVFLSVASHLSFSEAAQECHLSQSSVSKAVKRLEEEMDVLLFERLHRSIALTAAGQCFYEDLQSALPPLTDAVARMRAFSAGKTIRLATAAPACLLHFREYVESYSATCPEIRIDLRPDEAPGRVLRELESGAVDFALLHRPPAPSFPFPHDVICEDPLYAVFPPDHPLAGSPSVPAEALSGEHLLEKSGHIRSLLADLSAQLGLTLQAENVSAQAPTRTHLLTKVSFGSGTALLYATDLSDLSLHGVSAVPVTGIPDMPLILARSRERVRREHQQRFLACLLEHLRQEAALLTDPESAGA